MKKVLVIDKSGDLTPSLQRLGIDSHAMALPLTPEKLKALIPLKAETVLAPAPDSPDAEYLDMLGQLSSVSRVILYGVSREENIHGLCREKGLPELLEATEPLALAEYLTATRVSDHKEKHGIIALETGPVPARVMERISTLFGYGFIQTTGTDEFLETMDREMCEIALVNISSPELDLQKLVCESFGNSRLTRMPVIAYGSLDHGGMISDFMGGLSRLTRVVLHYDELYSFLVDLYFRNSYYPLVKRSSRYSRQEDAIFSLGDTLGTFYWNNEEHIFEMPGFFQQDNISMLRKTAEMMKSLLIRSSGLTWLHQEKRSPLISEGHVSASRHPFASR